MRSNRNPWLIVLAACALVGAVLGAYAASKALQKPRSVIQVVTIRWSAAASPELRRAALEGIEKLAEEVPGVRSVWMRSLRVQPRDHMSAYALEFEDQAAAERFARHPAHDAWNKSFLYLVDETHTQQVTN